MSNRFDFIQCMSISLTPLLFVALSSDEIIRVPYHGFHSTQYRHIIKEKKSMNLFTNHLIVKMIIHIIKNYTLFCNVITASLFM